MIDSAQMKQRLHDYIELFNRRDHEGVAALYADDAVLEDPVGRPPIQGRDKILAFYKAAMANGAQLKLAAPVRGSHGNGAAMAFDVLLDTPQGKGTIHVIDVMRFNEAGKIVSMSAYWGQSDMAFQPHG